MKISPGIVSIETEDIIQHHLPSATAIYFTLCQLGNDPDKYVSQKIVNTLWGSRVNCQQCLSIFEVTSKYNKGDFDIKIREK